MFLATQVHTVTKHGIEFLQVGRASYAMESPVQVVYDSGSSEGPKLAFRGGWISNNVTDQRGVKNSDGVLPCAVAWVKHEKTVGKVDLQQPITTWLKDDALWGSHQEANQMRYMASYGGVFGQIHQVVPQADHSAVAVLSVHEGSPSGEPIGAQFLVKLTANPLKMEMIRPIHRGTNDWAGMSPLVLLREKASLLCVNGNEVDELSPSGQVVKKWVDLPPRSEVVGIAKSRWLIYRQDLDNGSIVAAADLERHTSFPLVTYEYKRGSHDNPTELRSSPVSSSSYLVFAETRNDSEQVKWYTYHLPDGKRAKLPGPADGVAGPYAIERSDNKITLYEAASGKLIAKNLK